LQAIRFFAHAHSCFPVREASRPGCKKKAARSSCDLAASCGRKVAERINVGGFTPCSGNCRRWCRRESFRPR
jgi:hypothetical protein